MSASTTVSNDTDETRGDVLVDSLKVLANKQLRRFERYPVYKDSGIEWLGEIPSHWGVKRIKYLAQMNPDSLPEDTAPTREILYIDIGSVDNLGRIIERASLTFAAAPSRARRLVQDGDVIISTVRTYLRAIAQIRLPEPGTVVSTGFAVIRPHNQLSANYTASALRAPFFVERVVANSKGVSFPAINESELATYELAVPPAREQQSIAAFLDRETERIDELIQKKEQLIGLLNEERIALITRIVTRGLDPNVPMKDSGVEWLDNIPAHWELVPLKGLLKRCDYGISESLAAGGEIRVLTMTHIQQGEVVLPEYGSVSQIDDALLLENGDLLFNRTNSRELVGKVGVFRGSRDDRITFASYLVRLTVHEGTVPEWLNYLLNSAGLIGLARSMALLSVNQANLNPARYTQIRVPRPDQGEQSAIAVFLNRETERFDALIFKVRGVIDRLKEFRTTIISAAVTGQIDVREEAT